MELRYILQTELSLHLCLCFLNSLFVQALRLNFAHTTHFPHVHYMPHPQACSSSNRVKRMELLVFWMLAQQWRQYNDFILADRSFFEWEYIMFTVAVAYIENFRESWFAIQITYCAITHVHLQVWHVQTVYLLRWNCILMCAWRLCLSSEVFIFTFQPTWLLIYIKHIEEAQNIISALQVVKQSDLHKSDTVYPLVSSRMWCWVPWHTSTNMPRGTWYLLCQNIKLQISPPPKKKFPYLWSW